MNSTKRQNDRILNEKLPRSVGAQYATGDQWRNNSIPSFFLELFLHWSPVVYWAPTDRGSFSFSILSFCLFILFMGSQRVRHDWATDLIWSYLIPVHFSSLIPRMSTFTLAISCLTLPICLDSWIWQSTFLCNIALYSIGPCFYHQSHPQLGILFALAPSLHSFWSYFSTDLQ